METKERYLEVFGERSVGVYVGEAAVANDSDVVDGVYVAVSEPLEAISVNWVLEVEEIQIFLWSDCGIGCL